MLPTRSVELSSSIWKRLCLHSYGPQRLHHSEEHFPAPNTHTHTYIYTHNNPPPSNPVRFPANSKSESRLEHFSGACHVTLPPFRPIVYFGPAPRLSFLHLNAFLFTLKTTAKGTFLSVIHNTMVKSENRTWSRIRKWRHDGKKVRIPLERKQQRPGICICHAAARHVSILNIYIEKNS